MADRLEKIIFSSVFIVSLLVFLAHLSYTKTALYADTRFYFAYTRSIVKDFDLNLTNDFTLMGITPTPNSFGWTVNTYPPGAPLLWIPGYFLADQVTIFRQIIFKFPSSTGLEPIYQVFSGAISILLGTSGLFFVYQSLKKYFSGRISLLTTIAIFSTTNLFFYMAIEPLTSHSASFFAVSVFICYFLKDKKPKFYYLRLGFLGGLAGLIRPQNLAILIIPAIDLAITYKNKFKALTTSYLLLTAGILMTFSPQIILWKLFFNVYFTGPSWGYGFNFAKPHILHVLFNTQNGLFTLTPVVFISLVGLLLGAFELRIWNLFRFSDLGFRIFKRSEASLARIIFYALFYFSIQLFIISSWAEYTQGGSYSIRMLVNTYPLLAFGGASVMEVLYKRMKFAKTAFLIGCLTLLNMTLIIRYLLLY